MGRLRIISTAGDEVQEYAVDTEEPETLVAKEKFESLMKDHQYLAFKVDTPGKPGEQIKEFDPSAREIVVMPPLAGGCA